MDSPNTDTEKSAPAIVSPPNPALYLPEVIEKEVVKAGLTHPLSLYPTAVGIGSALAGVILGWPLLYEVALVGLVGPLWASAQIFLFSDKNSKQYLDKLDAQREEYKRYTRELVRAGLSEQFKSAKAQRYAEQGRAQFDKIAETLKSIRTVLGMKLHVRELTFHRFLGAAEQAYLSVLDNLKNVVATLRSLNSIDTTYIDSRLHELGASDNPSDVDKTEMAALSERRELWRKQLSEVSAMLTRNEEAMTAMEHISAKVARWQTDKHFATSDMETAICELSELAEFAQKMTDN